MLLFAQEEVGLARSLELDEEGEDWRVESRSVRTTYLATYPTLSQRVIDFHVVTCERLETDLHARGAGSREETSEGESDTAAKCQPSESAKSSTKKRQISPDG